MQSKKIKLGGMLVAASLLVANPASAIDFGNVMNPSKWFGGSRDRYDEDYYYGDAWGPGYGGYPPPYGAPGFGAPGVGVPGYGYPGGAYGAPGAAYGAPGLGYGAPGGGFGAPAYPAPGYAAPESGSDSLEVQQLKQRIRELEEANRKGAGSQAQQPAYPQPPMPSYGAQQPYSAQQPGYGRPPAPQPGHGGQPGYGSAPAPQPAYGGQPGYGTPPAGGGGNKWYYREDPSLPPMTDQ